MSNNINLIETIVEIVNRARRALGIAELEDLPAGRRRNPYSCPIARALERRVRVYPGVILFSSREEAELVDRAWENRGVRCTDLTWCSDLMWEVRVPEMLRLFISDFDRGFYDRYAIAGEQKP